MQCDIGIGKHLALDRPSAPTPHCTDYDERICFTGVVSWRPDFVPARERNGSRDAFGFNRTADAELKVAFPLSMLLFCWSAVG